MPKILTGFCKIINVYMYNIFTVLLYGSIPPFSAF